MRTYKQLIHAEADSDLLKDLASENMEDAVEEDNGTVILGFTGNDAERERGRKAYVSLMLCFEEKAREWEVSRKAKL